MTCFRAKDVKTQNMLMDKNGTGKARTLWYMGREGCGKAICR